jgi:drug/metabolite transporter (DMT)-like permease
LNSLTGPILGVTCTVWALQSLPAGEAQSIAAVAPLISVPFAYWLNGHRPPALFYLGAVVAIGGLIGVYLWG